MMQMSHRDYKLKWVFDRKSLTLLSAPPRAGRVIKFDDFLSKKQINDLYVFKEPSYEYI